MFITSRCKLLAFVLPLLFTACLLIFPSRVSADQAALTIIKDGQARAQLVLADSPSRKYASLQKYFKLITGATLPIVTEPVAGTPITIYVGHSAAADKLNLPKNTYENGAYHIVTGDNWIALIGDEKDFEHIEPWGHMRSKSENIRVNTEWKAITGEPFFSPAYNLYLYHYPKPGVWLFDGGGVLNAAYQLLRCQGCEWYMAGDIGQYVPKASTINLPRLHRDFIPDFKMRDLSFFHDHLGVSEDEAMWRLRMGVQGRASIMGITQPAHGSKFIHMTQEMRDAHPDMFAILNGKRNTDHAGIGAPCLSSQDFFDLHVKFIRTMFDHYDQPAVNIDMVDGYAFLCECDQCRTLGTPERNWNGSVSDYVWGYLNRVAKEVYKTHPNKMLFGLSYGSYQLPPEKIDQLSPNLGVIICQTRSNIYNASERKRIEDLRQAWLKKLPSGQLYNWDYYLNNWAPRRPYAFMPTYFPNLIAEDLRSLKGVAQGELVEIYDHKNPADYDWAAQAVNHLNIFITTRLYWTSTQTSISYSKITTHTSTAQPARK